jgi:hypothetical protein
MAAQVQAMVGWDEVAGEWYDNPEGEYQAANPKMVEFQVGVFGRGQMFAVVYGNAAKVQQVVEHFQDGFSGSGPAAIQQELADFSQTI